MGQPSDAERVIFWTKVIFKIIFLLRVCKLFVVHYNQTEYVIDQLAKQICRLFKI